MTREFEGEYCKQSDDDLLRLASDRESLTDEARTALDLELSRRNLTKADVDKYQTFLKLTQLRESKTRLRKVFGTRRSRMAQAIDIFSLMAGAVVIALTVMGYQSLPGRYHLNSGWEEAAFLVMVTSVLLAVFGSFGWRKLGFWASLLVSSAIHVVMVHAWIVSNGSISGYGQRGTWQLAVLVGLALFFVVYGFGSQLKRKIYGEAELPHG